MSYYLYKYHVCILANEDEYRGGGEQKNEAQTALGQGVNKLRNNGLFRSDK